jgi:hypothetical protein
MVKLSEKMDSEKKLRLFGLAENFINTKTN